MIPQKFIDEVQTRTDIGEVISSYIPLKRAGRNFKALCPFHGEKTPSFMISPQKQIFHCFGCGQGGTVIQFIMQYEKASFVEAIEILARRLGLEIPYQRGEKQKLKTILYDAVEQAAQVFNKNLLSRTAAPVMSYLNKRGISKEVIEQFRIGYAAGRNALADNLRKKGFSLEVLEKSSLVIARESGFRDLFADRIMFPVCDSRARVVGFGARLWRQSSSAPKYINSLENPLYSKRQHLFGLNFAKDHILKEDCVIVVEGYLDMIIPFMAGIKNIVASLGTALTSEQIRLIRRYTTNIVLVFDSDKAGQAASLRALDLLLEN
ncbi:MAG: DNA primase, partial [Candidatus Omnitrophota bacterium]